MLADCFGIVTDKLLHDRRADAGILHQTRRGVSETMKREIVLSPSSVATGAIRFLVVGAWWNEAN